MENLKKLLTYIYIRPRTVKEIRSVFPKDTGYTINYHDNIGIITREMFNDENHLTLTEKGLEFCIDQGFFSSKIKAVLMSDITNWTFMQVNNDLSKKQIKDDLKKLSIYQLYDIRNEILMA